MGERLRGVVRLFKTAEVGGRYGFFKAPGLPDIFFRFEKGRCFFEVDGAVVWSETARIQRDPRAGEKVFFELEDRVDGKIRAAVWGYASDAEAVEKRMEEAAAA